MRVVWLASALATLMYSVPLAPPTPAAAALPALAAPDIQRLLISDEFQCGDRCQGQERMVPGGRDTLDEEEKMTGGK